MPGSLDVIVVGGGIGGTVLAELLGRGGRRVLVLERSSGPPPFVRPEGLWPATVELLSTLVPRARLEAEAFTPLTGVIVHDGRRSHPVRFAEAIARSGVQPVFTNPNATRELLLGLDGFELRRGVEVIAVLKDRDRVIGARARETASGAESDHLAAWTVGDDGVHSRVREACGIGLATRIFPLEFLCFGGEWPASFPPATVRIWLNPSRREDGIAALACGPAPGGRAIGIVPLRPARFDRALPASEAWKRFLGRDADLRAVAGGLDLSRDATRIRRPWGHASRYGVSGAVVMGDAAHPVSPVGGQGANMSVADARALARLALAGTPDLVAAYERARRPANDRSLGLTRAAARFIEAPDWLVPPPLVNLAIRSVVSTPALIARFLRFVSTAFLD